MRLIDILAAGVTDDTGARIASGSVYFYEAGTTTLQTVYQDFDLETPHANPATLDAAGRLFAYSNERLKLVILNSSGTTVRTIDNVGTALSDITTSSNTGLAGLGLVAASDGSLDVNPDGTSLTIVNDVLKVKDSGISTIKIADDAVTAAKIANNTIFDGNCGTTGTFTVGTGGPVLRAVTTGLESDAGFFYPHTNSKAALDGTNSSGRTLRVKTSGAATSLPIVVSAVPSDHGLMIVRGQVNDDRTTVSRGEGFTAAANGVGRSLINLTTAFAEAPVAIACSYGSAAVIATAVVNSTSQVEILTHNTSGVAVNNAFSFVLIGQRGA